MREQTAEHSPGVVVILHQDAGFDCHLTKPVDVAELRSVLRKLSA